MKKRNYVTIVLLLIVFMGACSSGSDEKKPDTPDTPVVPDNPTPVVPPKILMNLNITIGYLTNIPSFVTDDKAGVYAVKHVDGSSAELQFTGNLIDNLCLNYKDTWAPVKTTYWSDNTTKEDIYVYYPYTYISSVTAQAFSVKEDQTTEKDYKASIFLWSKASEVTPTEKTIDMAAQNLFCCICVKLTPGSGYTAESLTASNPIVKLTDMKVGATVNLSTGIATATGEGKTITSLKTADGYKAFIVPQTITKSNFITVTINGNDYKIEGEYSFAANKTYTFTLVVNKINNGINVSIGKWGEEDNDNGGVAK
jgi:hypothetical protein